jgi:diaminohydroxyphosphoribosylaminopyrimidine deaminase / 5-amino-6-(5-phosphoribosylamino)uracil reductase
MPGLPLLEVFRALGELELPSVMIEAGPRLVAGALAAGAVDKVMLFYAPRFLDGDALEMLPRTAAEGYAHLPAAVPALQNITLQRFGADFAVEGYLRDVYGDR